MTKQEKESILFEYAEQMGLLSSKQDIENFNEYCSDIKDDEDEQPKLITKLSKVNLGGVEKFPRKCDITGKGIKEGHYIESGNKVNYISTDELLLKYLKENTHYTSIEQSFEDEYHYYTEWEELDDDGFYLADGTHITSFEDIFDFKYVSNSNEEGYTEVWENSYTGTEITVPVIFVRRWNEAE